MKTFLIFLFGLAIGFVAALTTTKTQTSPSLEMASKSMESELLLLQATVENQQTELIAYETEIAELNNQLAAIADVQEGEESADEPSNPFMEMTKQIATEMSANIYTTEVVKLKNALDLNTDQMEAVEAYYRSQEDQHARAMELVMSGMSMEEVQQLLIEEMEANPYTSLEELLQAELSPQQLEAYESYKETERAEREEASAYRELSEIQTAINMDESQKDAVFEVLFAKEYELSSEEWATHGISPDDPKSFLEVKRIENARLLETLGAHLSPEQIEVLRVEQERELRLIEASSSWMQ